MPRALLTLVPHVRRALRVLVFHVTRALRVFVACVSCALLALVSHVYRILRAFVPLCLVFYVLLFSYLVVPYLLSGLTFLEPTCSCTSRASYLTCFRVLCVLCQSVSHPPRILGALYALCLSYLSFLMPSILSCLSCFVVLVSYTSLLCF